MPNLYSPTTSPNDLRTAIHHLAQDAVFTVMVCHDLFLEIEKSHTMQQAKSLSAVGKETTAIHQGIIEAEIAAVLSALETHEAKDEGDHSSRHA